MPGRALQRASSPNISRAHVIFGESVKTFKMSEELPILKGILNGVVNYHNARMSLIFILLKMKIHYFLLSSLLKRMYNKYFSLTYNTFFFGVKAGKFLSFFLQTIF